MVSVSVRDISTTDPLFVTLDTGRQVAYTEYGDPDGLPILFFHGTPGSRLLAGLFDSTATDAGIRLLAFDRPGFGQSDPWPMRSISDAGQFASAVLDDADVQTAHCLAFSGGSKHAIATAGTHNERISTVNLVSGATPPTISTETPSMQRILTTLARRTPLLLRGLLRGQAWLAARRDPSFVVSLYRSNAVQTSVAEDVATVVKMDFIEAMAHSHRGSVTEFRNAAAGWEVDFDSLDVPVSLSHGQQDTNVPIADARRLATMLPTGTLTENEHTDHLQTLLQSVPAIFEEVVC